MADDDVLSPVVLKELMDEARVVLRSRKNQSIPDKPSVLVEKVADEYTLIRQDKYGSFLRSEQMYSGMIHAALQPEFVKGEPLPLGQRGRLPMIVCIKKCEESITHQTIRIGV